MRGEHVLLRIYLRAADRAPHSPTSERVVVAASKFGLAGATVLRGILGFGSHGVERPSVWSLAEHVPVIVELVDSGERIAAFVREELSRIMVSGMATLERAAVLMYRQGKAESGGTPLSLAESLKPLSTVPLIEETTMLKKSTEGILLRVFIGEDDRFDGKPLHEAIVQKARELGLSGATVLRGSEGFGANSVVHRAALLEMSVDLPIVLELVDERPKIELLLPHLEAMVNEGMVTMEYVTVLMYRHNESGPKVVTESTDG